MAGQPADHDAYVSLAAQLKEAGPWDASWLDRLMARHFDHAGLPAQPAALVNFARQGSSQGLQTSDCHIGFSGFSMAAMITPPGPDDWEEDELRNAVMAVDWAPAGARQRLESLKRLRGAEKAGLDWLTGYDRGMPSFRSLKSHEDRLAWLVVGSVGRFFESRDQRQLRALEKALAFHDAKGVHKCLNALVRNAVQRGVTIGYVVPRLVLLRASARDLSVPGDLAFASLWLAEIARQYDEYAPDETRSAYCLRVALSFAMEAARTPDGREAAASFVAQLLRTALARGYHRSQLTPLLF